MLKDLFSNRLFIGALAFFVLCVGGSLFYSHHETQKGEAGLAETQDRLKQWNERQKQQPTTQAPVVEQPPQDGHFHADGTFHAGPHEPTPVEAPPPSVTKPAGDVSVPFVGSDAPFDDPYLRMVDGFTVTSQFAIMMAPYEIGPDWAAMSAEELAAAIETINRTHGVPRDDALWPPEGYSYAFGGTTSLSNGDNVWLDDNGYPILSKRGAPFFDIAWVDGFRPPPDVYADFKALHKQSISAKINEMPEEAARLSAEKKAIKMMYRGRIPSGPFGGGMVPEGMDPPQYFRQFQAIQTQLKRNAFEAADLAYLMDYYVYPEEFGK